MPKGTTLTKGERAAILAYADTGMSSRAIATAIKRSKGVVCSFLSNPKEYATKKHPGRPPKISATALRLLLREASKGDRSAKQLRDDLQLGVGVKRVQQLLRAAPHLSYERPVASPWMTKTHKVERVK